MEKIYINFSEEQGNYLQRLGNEVDSKVFLIDRMFANHAGDTDVAMFESVPFKHYMKEYEKARTEWDLAKEEFSHTYLRPQVEEITGKKDVKFNWSISDFLSGQCEVMILE